MASNTFQLVFDPGGDDEQRIPFTVSEADLDDALDYGRVERDEPFERQISGTAYHMVMDQRVCDDDRIVERPWVVLQNGVIIARNHMAIEVTDEDVA